MVDLRDQRQALQAQRQQLERLRVGSQTELARRNQALQRISQQQSQIDQAEKQLDSQRKQQLDSQRSRINTINEIIKQNAGGKSVGSLYSQLNQEDRDLVNKLLEEQDISQALQENLFDQKLVEFKAQQLQSKTAQSKMSSEYQGPIQPGESEAQFRATGQRVKLTQGPIQPGKSEIVFRELGKSVPLSREKEFFTTVKSAPPTINRLNPFEKANVFFTRSVPTAIKESKEFFKNKGVIGGLREIQKATSLYQLRKTVTPPSKQDYLGLLLLPAFATGTASQTAAEAELIIDDVTGQLITRKELARRTFERLLRSGVNEVTVAQGTLNQKTVNIREIVRNAIIQNKNNPANLKKLRDLLVAEGRGALFDDLVIQENLLTARPKIVKGAVDIPQSIELGSVITSTTSDLPKAEASIFFATGEYERTSFTAPRQIPSSLISGKANIFLSNQQNKQNVLFAQSQIPKQESVQRQPLSLGQTSLNRQTQLERVRSRAATALLLGLGTQQQQRQIARGLFGQKQPLRKPLEPSGRPKIAIGIVSPPSTFSSKKTPSKAKNKKIQTQIKRFGVWRNIGRPTSYDKAIDLGVKETASTLGASFRLTKGKEVLPIKKLPKEYYLKGNVGIERKKYRLDNLSELQELKLFKKRKMKFF